MKLLSTRDLNQGDPLPTLGKRLPRPEEVKAEAPPPLRPTGTPGVFEGADGKLETQIDENKAARCNTSRDSARLMRADWLVYDNRQTFQQEYLQVPYSVGAEALGDAHAAWLANHKEPVVLAVGDHFYKDVYEDGYVTWPAECWAETHDVSKHEYVVCGPRTALP